MEDVEEVEDVASEEEAPDMVHQSGSVINYMSGVSYEVGPVITVKMMAASSMLKENKYYVSGSNNFSDFLRILKMALDTDFKAILDFCVELRNDYLMRHAPQIIFVEACCHPRREEFTKKCGGYFAEIHRKISKLPTDLSEQLKHFLSMNNGTKNKLPGILKRCWAKYLEQLTSYQAVKYLNKAKIVDLIRLSHPDPKVNNLIDKIVRSSSIELSEDQNTWEKLHSTGKNWHQIIELLGTKIPHMALLRNLCNIAAEYNSAEMLPIMDQLVRGVEHGKQFPYAYYAAYTMITGLPDSTEENLKKKDIIIAGLDKALLESIKSFPQLDGFVTSLCDNSGSAHGAFTSEYGSISMAVIGNLSGILTAMSSSKGGEIAIFGDKLHIYPVNKERGVIEQLDEVNAIGKGIGQSTENGIWLWFFKGFNDSTFNNKTDYLFIYSDQQAGRGGLYGENHSDYSEYIYQNTGNHIDVMALVKKHRQTIHSKMAVFSVQIAGYDNNVVSNELIDRAALLYGWTGKEVLFAQKYIQLWNTVGEQ